MTAEAWLALSSGLGWGAALGLGVALWRQISAYRDLMDRLNRMPPPVAPAGQAAGVRSVG